MIESERLLRFKENRFQEGIDLDNADEEFCKRIVQFLNDPRINHTCMVDAYYYDFSVIPRKIQQELQLWRDHYFIYGITDEGEFVTKWVDRWDLDSFYEVVDGKVTGKKEQTEGRVYTTVIPPEISYYFDKNLLSNPEPKGFINMFTRGDL